MKPLFVISSPFDTYSGYGARSRDLIKAIIETDKYDVKLLAQRWGNTPWGFCEDNPEWFTPSPEIPSNHNKTYKKHGEWAFPVFPSTRVLQGSPPTPYIWDDVCRPEDAAEQIMAVYKLTPEERKAKGLKGREWAINEAGFTGETQGKRVIEAFNELFETWKPREKYELINVSEVEDRIIKHKLLY